MQSIATLLALAAIFSILGKGGLQNGGPALQWGNIWKRTVGGRETE